MIVEPPLPPSPCTASTTGGPASTSSPRTTPSTPTSAPLAGRRRASPRYAPASGGTRCGASTTPTRATTSTPAAPRVRLPGLDRVAAGGRVLPLRGRLLGRRAHLPPLQPLAPGGHPPLHHGLLRVLLSGDPRMEPGGRGLLRGEVGEGVLYAAIVWVPPQLQGACYHTKVITPHLAARQLPGDRPGPGRIQRTKGVPHGSHQGAQGRAH